MPPTLALNRIDITHTMESGSPSLSSVQRATFAANTNLNLATILTDDRRYKSIETGQLRNAWGYSSDLLLEARQLLKPLEKLQHPILTVVVAGSFGRMEGGENSDFDFFVIADDSSVPSRQHEKEIVATVWQKLKHLPVAPPDNDGIFGRVVTPAILCDKSALGNLDYARHVFGLRIQLLTDSQPIYGTESFQKIQTDIVRWYCQPDYSPFAYSTLQYLQADLKRYFASYAIWHQYRHDKSFNDSWLMRQIKMQHSRLASYTALAISVMNIASKNKPRNNGVDENFIAKALSKQLRYTPLERLVMHWPAEHEAELLCYIDNYNRILELISDPDIRLLIINEDPESVNDRIKGFANASTPEPVLTEIINTVEKQRTLLATCVTHTMRLSEPSTSACWAL